MFGKTKKMLALLLALSMLFSMIPLGVSATETAEEEAQVTEEPMVVAEPVEAVAAPEETPVEQTMEEDAPVVASIEVEPVSLIEGTEGSWSNRWNSETQSYEEFYYYWWTHHLKGTIFFTDGTSTAFQGNSFVYNGVGYSMGSSDSQRNMPWIAGNTYTVTIYALDGSAQVSITIQESPVQAIAVAPITMIDRSGGHINTCWNEETQTNEEFYEYCWWCYWNGGTVYFTDGSSSAIENGVFTYNGQEYSLDYHNDQSENHWYAGNTYTTTVSAMGISTEVSITIAESPVVSVELEPLCFIEGTNGYLSNRWNEETQQHDEYFEYDWWNHLRGTVYFSDGTSYALRSAYYEYDGEGYCLNYTDGQHTDHWAGGNTYSETLLVMGVSAPVEITIDNNPISEIVAEPLIITEYEWGYWADRWNEEAQSNESYFHYNWDIALQATVVFTDGTSAALENRFFTYKGREYELGFASDQNENPWLVGNTYTGSIYFVNFSTTVSIRIVSLAEISPKLELNVEQDIAASGNRVGYVTFTPEVSGAYMFSSNANADTYGFLYDEDLNELARNDDGGVGGNFLISWYLEAGKTYILGVRFYNYDEGMIPVVVTPGPVTSVEIEPLSLVEGTCGAWYETWDEDTQQYILSYRYAWWNYLQGTVYFADGTSQNFYGGGFSYDGETVGFYYEDNQAKEPWGAGNTYTITVSALGVSTDVTITIQQTPIESIVLEPISIIENTCGYENSYWDDATQSDIPYYFYSWSGRLEGTVYFADGSSTPIRYGYFSYNGQDIWLQCSNNQREDIWTVGNTYTETATAMGVSAQVSIIIEQSPVLAIVMEPVVLPAQTFGSWGHYWNEDCQIYELYYCYEWYNWNSMSQGLIFLKDGTSIPIVGEFFTYQGRQYEIQYQDDQQNNHWLEGNTYLAQISAMGAQTDLVISIATDVTEDAYSYILQNGKIIITGCSLTDAIIELPEKIKGMPVVGFASLGEAENYCRELIIPDSVTVISSRALGYDIPLEKLTIGAGVKYIDPGLLDRLTQLQYIHISEYNPNYTSVDGILYNKDVTQLRGVPHAYPDTYYVPESITDISLVLQRVISFIPHEGLTDWTVIDGVVYNDVVSMVYSVSKERTGTLVLPDSVTQISGYGLARSNLTHVTIPDSVTEIAYCAFYESASLQSVDLPDTLKAIRYSAFRDCTGLEAIAIPSGCTSLSSNAFENCTGLEALYIEDLATWCGMYIDGYYANPLYYAKNLYVNGKQVTDLVIPESVERIEAYTFEGLNANSITIPGNVKTVGGNAFYKSTATRLSLEEGIEGIGECAFANNKLTSLVLPDSLTVIGSDCFSNCVNLQEVVIGKGLDSISYGAFYNTDLRQITIPANVTYISAYAFTGCDQLKKVVFECEELYIWRYAFQNCPLEEINLPENTTYIGEQTFQGATAATVKIPDAVTEITYRCFAFNDCLMSVVIPAGVQQINPCAFEGCDNLGHVLYEGTQEQWDNLAVESAELRSARIHTEASAQDIAVRRYCHQIQHYCAVCNKWEHLDIDGQHSYSGGRCTICGYSEYAAMVGDVGYKTFAEAMSAAGSGDTIRLTNHTTVDQLVLSSGANLDLNGVNLEVSRGVVVLAGQILDSSEGEGVLLTNKAGLVWVGAAEAAQMPLYDTEAGGYRFYSYAVTAMGVRKNGDGSLVYGFRFDFGSTDAYRLLTRTENSGISANFTLSWGNGQTKKFAFSNELLCRFADMSLDYGDTVAMMVTIRGTDTLEPGTQLRAVASINSDLGLSRSGREMIYTIK